MIATKALPDLCKERKQLVDHLLHDISLTASLISPEYGWATNQRYNQELVMAVFSQFQQQKLLHWQCVSTFS